MECFTNMSSRILTSHDTNRLKGFELIQNRTNINPAEFSKPLPMLPIPENSVPDLPKEVARSPTSAEVAQQLANLQAVQEQSVTAFQTTSAQQPVYYSQPTQQTRPPIPNLTIAGQVATLQPQVELVPGSIVPIPRASVVSQFASTNGAPTLLPVANVEGAVVAETAEGNPIIQVRTDNEALRESGLTQPGDATQSIRASSMGTLNRRPRRTASPQMRMQEQAQEQYQEGGDEEQSSIPSGHAVPLRVIKLG